MPLPSKISNWGNHPSILAQVTEFTEKSEVHSNLQTIPSSLIPRGAGLSYGDASLAPRILSTVKYNKILEFNDQHGLIKVEAGATLDEILKIIVPKGWFLPVTPGTKFITVGGAVAGDVHGKNHHCENSFCKYVTHMEVMMADGTINVCNANSNPTLFKTVCGGLGLTCVILTVQFQLKAIETSYISQQNIVIRNLDEMIDRLKEFELSTYSVAWIDCLAQGRKLGRGVLMLGEHATRQQVPLKNHLDVHSNPKISIPFYFPSFVLNPITIRAFNFIFYSKYKMDAKKNVVHYDPYFYPLDFMRDWNKLYGKRGFLQYQFVIPLDKATKGLRVILDAISKDGAASFLAVLKILGPGENTLSFPLPGFTLALDFPVSKKIFSFLDRLDQIVVDLGGRIYLVKDARMASDIYWRGYPNAAAFKEQVNQYDPLHKFSSSLSERLKMV